MLDTTWFKSFIFPYINTKNT